MFQQLKFIFNVALKHLNGKRKQTILVILGVATGSMVMILTLSLGEGIVQDIKDKIIETAPYITLKGEKVNPKERLLFDSTTGTKYSILSRIKPDEKKEIKPFDETIALINTVYEIDGAAPFVLTRGVIRKGTLSRQGIIKGILPEEESKVANLKNNIVKGSLNELNYTKNGILLGSGFAKKIHAKYHDIILITGENGKLYRVKVVGMFASGFSAVDDNNVYVNLSMGQLINDMPTNSVSGIGIHTRSLEVVNETSNLLKNITGYKTETWEEANENVLTLFKRNNSITLFLVLFVFVVSGFGIANVLITIVLQKQPDIAVMKSFGVTKGSIEAIFIVEGLILGIIGALGGAAAGYILTNIIASLPVSYGESAVVRNDHIAIVQRLWFYFVTGGFSLLISALSAVGPARRAAKLKPVEILRA